METSPSLTAIASALSVAPSPRLNRVSCAPCFHRRRRRPPRSRCSRKQQDAAEDGAQREAKNEEAAKGRRIQGWFGSLDRFGVDILSIAVPAALALAADPIAALVDTAFVGHLGAPELWECKAPPKCKHFGWLMLLGRCWTSYRMKRHGLIDDDTCSLCDQEVETMDHLLLHCAFSRDVWWTILQISGFGHLFPTSHDGWIDWWLCSRLKLPKNLKVLFDSLCLLVAWNLCKERNSRFFNRTSSTVSQLCAKIKDEGFEWALSGVVSVAQILGRGRITV